MMRFLRDLLFRNWALKIVALALALIIWIIFVPQDKIISEKTLAVPIEITNVPTDMAVVERPVSSVEITIRAPKRILGEITPSSVSARLDLEHATVYQQEYPLNKAMIALPPGAEVVEIRPNKVLVKLERTREEVMSIRPGVMGKVAAGYVVARIEVDPPQVTVHGPVSKIKAKDSVTTSPVDITSLTETTVFEADIILPSPELRLVSAQTKARVTIVIAENKGASRSAQPRKK